MGFNSEFKGLMVVMKLCRTFQMFSWAR